ncbi:MAG: hypothetical protein WKG07_43720 [Hymenobacter sp.]
MSCAPTFTAPLPPYPYRCAQPFCHSLCPVSLSGLLALGLAAAGPAAAQTASLLPGRWAMRQISFIATQTVPPAMLERMDDPEVAELNQELRAGAAHLQVEFRADGTYQFTIARAGQPERLETGTYQLTASTLRAKAPAPRAALPLVTSV